jgi:hypothetical protein
MERLRDKRGRGPSNQHEHKDLPDEKWWGLHSIESCYVKFTLCSWDGNAVPDVKYYQSYSLAVVTEKAIIFVLMANPKEAVTVVDMIRTFRRGKKYQVLISNIVDISVTREANNSFDDDGPCQKVKLHLPSDLGGL